MSHLPFAGVGVALVTLFDEDGEVDAKATGKHAARLVDAGVQAIATAGSTGEAGALSADERVAVLEAELCIAAFGGDVQAQRRLFPSHVEMRQDSPRVIKRMTADKYGVSPTCRI